MTDMLSSKKFSKNLEEIFAPIQENLDSFNDLLIDSVGSNNLFLDKITKYIITAGGKRVRPAICFLISKAINKNISQGVLHISLAVEQIHTATLIHDDVIDESDSRRGLKTINAVWDSKSAVIAGDYLLAQALKSLSQTNNPEVISLFAKTMSEMCIGEIQQAFEGDIGITVKDYIKKSERKTAMLFVASLKSIALKETDNIEIIEAIENFAENFGILFQVTDDILDITSNEKFLGKPVGIDLLNGTITAPVIFAMQENSYVKNIIENGDLLENNIQEVIKCIKESNALNRAYELASLYAENAINSLACLPDSSYKQALKDIALYTLNRSV